MLNIEFRVTGQEGPEHFSLLLASEQLQQLGDVGGDASGLVGGQQHRGLDPSVDFYAEMA
jgi:hypothetical protein